jgi:16S rRNA (cytosine1402-N4)-methyltransferase
MNNNHVPVLLDEAVNALEVKKGCWYIDGTFGRGGHTSAILAKGGKVIAFDVDQEAIEFGQQNFAAEIEAQKLLLVRANFEKLSEEIYRLYQKHAGTSQEISEIHGALFDFGVSSPQLESPTRGFSFQYDADLDMRMDDRLGVKAKDLIAILSEKQLADLFWRYGGEEMSRAIARKIVYARAKKPIQSVDELVTVIEQVKHRHGHLNPATKVFQALRIAVNDELGAIEKVLPQALDLIMSGSKLVTISFHEGEDRVVKNMFRDWELAGKGTHQTHKVVTAGEEELKTNTRSRSAKLRIFERA